MLVCIEQEYIETERADVWAAAWVAYELLVGETPSLVSESPQQDALSPGSLPGFLNFLSEDCADFLQSVRPLVLPL